MQIKDMGVNIEELKHKAEIIEKGEPIVKEKD